MEKLTSQDKQLLQDIADLHDIPEGAYNIRKDGSRPLFLQPPKYPRRLLVLQNPRAYFQAFGT